MIKKSTLIIIGTVSVILLSLGIVAPIMMDQIIKKQAQNQVQLSQDTTQKWSQIPGETKVDVMRNFTFFNLKNSREVIFQNAIPEFQETQSFDFHEKYTFENMTYNSDKSIVDFYMYQYFISATGTPENQQIDSLNLGPLGAWYQMKNADMAQIALNGLSAMFYTFKGQLIDQVMGTGLQDTLFKSEKNVIKLMKAIKGVSQQQAEAIASDPNYGMAHQETASPWIQISYTINQKGEIQPANTLSKQAQGTLTLLQNYFGLTYEQMKAIQSLIYNGKFLQQGVHQAYDFAIDKNYCNKMYKKAGPCDSNTLSAAQWTSQGITQFPPSIPIILPAKPIESSASVNSTVLGYPEISYYYKKAFSVPESPFYVKGGEDKKFKDQFLHTDIDLIKWGIKAMETLPGDQYTTGKYSLLNIGNLRKIFYLGQQFDKSNDGEDFENSHAFDLLHKQIGLSKKTQTYIFWNYMKYMVQDFIERKKEGGNQGAAVIGVLIGGGLYEYFTKLNDYFLPTVTATIVEGRLKNQSCQNVFMLSKFSQQNSQDICSSLNINPNNILNIDSIKKMMEICTFQNLEQRQEFMISSKITEKSLDDFCQDFKQDGEYESYGFAVKDTSNSLKQHYNCNMAQESCTNYEFAAKQWADSSISNNVADIMKPYYQTTTTVSEWFPQVFPTPFENGWFAPRFYQEYYPQTDKQQDLFYPTIQQATQLLSFDKLFSGPMVTQILLNEKDGEQQLIQDMVKDKFFFTNKQQLITYLRYVGINISFGGYLTNKKVKEFLFNYQDPFVTKMKETNPQQGGDPSLNPILAFNQLNQTAPPMKSDSSSILWKQSMHTGSKDIDQVRYYEKISGFETIRVVKQMFDGENIYWGSYNPYQEDIKLKGTDGMQSPPETKTDNLDVYIFTLFNQKTLNYEEEIDHHGLNCFRHSPTYKTLGNSTTNPENAKLWSYGPDGLTNMTTLLGAPMFSSQTHFYLAILNYTLKKIQKLLISMDLLFMPNKVKDQTYVDIEEYTGITISSILNLQINYQMEPDILFPVNKIRYLPVYYMARGATWTNDQVSGQFSQLKLGLAIKLAILIIGITVGSILLIVGIYLYIRRRKQMKVVKRIQAYSELADTQGQNITSSLMNNENNEQNNINHFGNSEFSTAIEVNKKN